MAGVGWIAQVGQPMTPGIGTGTAPKTMLQMVAGANAALMVKEWSVSFRGVSTTGQPILVEVLRQGTGGTFNVGNVTPVTPKLNPDDAAETVQVGYKADCSAEPSTTSDVVLFAEYVHPQTGFCWQAPFGQGIKVGSTDRLSIRTTADQNVLCCARFCGEE